MSPITPNNAKAIFLLIPIGFAPSSPYTKKLTPKIIMIQLPIYSVIFDEDFKYGVVKTSLIGLIPNNRVICFWNIPIKIKTIPKINHTTTIRKSPFQLVPLTVNFMYL